MKTCRTCNQTKPADAYRGTRSACRECEKARRREWYAAQAVKPYQRPEMKAYYRQWYAAHAEPLKARAVEWTKANPDKRRDVCRENTARQRAKLSDAYVRRMLARKGDPWAEVADEGDANHTWTLNLGGPGGGMGGSCVTSVKAPPGTTKAIIVGICGGSGGGPGRAKP